MVGKINDTPEKTAFDKISTHFYDLIHDLLFILDSEGKILKINKAITERLGYSKEDLYKKSILVIHPKERQQEAAKIVNKVLKDKIDSINIPILTKDGKLVPVETKITKGKIGNKYVFIGISRDISERLKVENALLKEKKFTEMALNTQTDTFFVFDPLNGTPLRWNKAFSYISGYSDEEISKLKAPETYYNKDDLQKLSEAIERIKSGETTVNEARLKTKDGKFIPFEYVASGIFDEKNDLKYIVAIGRNTSERKVAEKKLLESEEKYRNLFEKSPNANVLLDLTGKIIECNSTTEKIFGYPIDELVGHNYLELSMYSERMINTLKERFRAITKKIYIEPQELEIKKKDGSIAIIKNEISFIKIGEKDFFQAIIQDITEQKKTEQKLKESEEKFRSIAEHSGIGIFIVQDNEFKFINHRALEEMGYSREELMNWTMEDILKTAHPEDRDFIREQAIKKQRGDKDVVVEYEARYINKNNQLIWVKNLSKTIMYDGRPAVLISHVYINDMKQAELKLKESEEKYRHLFDSTPFPIIILDSNGIIFDANATTLDVYGVKKGEIIGKTLLDIQYFSPEIFKLFNKRRELLLKGESVEPLEIPVVLKDGAKRWINSNISLFHVEGKAYFQVIIQDITDRKDSELKLKESELKFRRIFEAIPDIYFLISGDSTILDYKGRKNELYVSPESFMGKKLTDIMPFAIGKKSLNMVKKVIETREPQIFEYDLEMNKKLKSFEARLLYLSDDKVLIFVRDITDRRKAQQKLIESENSFRDLYEEAPNAYFSIDPTGNIRNCNRAAEELLGYPKEELFKIKVLDLYASNINGVDKARELFKVFLKGNEINNEELQMRKKTGELIWINLSVKPILDNFGNVIESRSVIIDINERKIAQEELKASEENYRKAYDRVAFYKDLFAHDLNNVLQSILSSVELYSLFNEDMVDSNKIEDLLQIINDSALRGAKLISNVQKLSKLEDSTLVTFEVNLRDFLKDAINFTKNKFQNREIYIKVEGNSKVNNVQANELLLDVFENILINAVNYNDNEKVEIFIKITEVNKKNLSYIKMEFIDNGIGIEDARKEKIFEVGNREFKGSRGMGMGLSLVKNTIKSFGGEICIKDKVKGDYTKGSNFILIIRKS